MKEIENMLDKRQLSRVQARKIAKSQKDLEEFKYYMVNKRWRDLCPFQSRWPYLSVVDMIKDDIVLSVLDQPNTITYKRYNFDALNNVMKKKLS